MHWPYVAIVLGALIGLSAVLLKGLLASRRQRLARESGRMHIEGMGEVAGRAGISGGILLVAAASLNTVTKLASDPLILMLSVVCAAILVLSFGVQLGRLLMRYQLHRLRGMLDTVTGELVRKSSGEQGREGR